MLGVRIRAEELVDAYFDVPQQYRGFGFWGERSVEVPIRIAWHGREGIHLTLSNEYDLNLGQNGLVLGSLPIAGGATWSGIDTVTGFLAKETDESYARHARRHERDRQIRGDRSRGTPASSPMKRPSGSRCSGR